MRGIDRPLSRRAFFRAAGVTTVALSASSALHAAERSPSGEQSLLHHPDDLKKTGAELDALIKEKALKDGLLPQDEASYRDLVVNMWGHFRTGTQGVPLDLGVKGMLFYAYGYEDPCEDKPVKGTGRYFIERLDTLEPGSEKEFNTRYCCYLCGHLALVEARKRGGEVTISVTDYQTGWKLTKERIFALFDRAKCDDVPAETMAAGC